MHLMGWTGPSGSSSPSIAQSSSSELWWNDDIQNYAPPVKLIRQHCSSTSRSARLGGDETRTAMAAVCRKVPPSVRGPVPVVGEDWRISSAAGTERVSPKQGGEEGKVGTGKKVCSLTTHHKMIQAKSQSWEIAMVRIPRECERALLYVCVYANVCCAWEVRL